MKNSPFALAAMLLSAASAGLAADTRDRAFDADWRFLRGDAPGAEAPAFDDAAWRGLDVPHDWSIEDLSPAPPPTAPGEKTPTRIGPFAPDENPSHHFTGHTLGGIGWYRKSFTVGEADAGKQVAVRFDGVYMNAELWINGHRLGEHPHGYTAFEFDLTPHLRPAGEPNLLAVRVRNEGRNTRWYAGSGIYRHVWLTVRDAVHVPTWGLFVTTPEVSREQALVKISADLRNAAAPGAQPIPATVRARVRDAAGRVVGESTGSVFLAADETRATERFIHVATPALWSPDSPTLYVAEFELSVAGRVTDTVITRFGIRSISADAERGFRLNGEPLKLKGGCIHHDNGPLGAAAIDRAEERKVELLKASGFNAVRTSHNPPSSAFLDACDRLGLLVIVEAFDQWTRSKERNEQDYHRFFAEWSDRDLAAMVRRDRNHPSVIMWSIGNEIPEQFQAEATARRLRAGVLAHDPTRFVTQGVCTDWGKVIKNWDALSDPGFTQLDIAGYNYLPEKYEGDHARHPRRVMYGSESFPKDAYDYWALVEKHPYIIGDFVWTAMDYLGEAGIGHRVLSGDQNPFFMPWPWFNAWCGDIDLIGVKKPQSFYRDVVWRRSPLEIAVHEPLPEGQTEVLSWWGWPAQRRSWTWPGNEGRPLKVSVYSRCDTVRLELDGRVVGESPVSGDTKLTATFDVPYAPGELRAFGLVNGKVVAQTALQTVGAPAAIRLVADRAAIRADRDDLAYVAIEIVDADGRLVPHAKVPLRLAVSGAGELAGHASAVPNEPASFRAPQRETFEGRALAILRPLPTAIGVAGEITLRVEAEGFPPATRTIRTAP